MNRRHIFDIRRDVSRRTRITLGITAWALVVGSWILLTQWDILPPFSVPKPAGVLQAFVRLWTEYCLLKNMRRAWSAMISMNSTWTKFSMMPSRSRCLRRIV